MKNKIQKWRQLNSISLLPHFMEYLWHNLSSNINKKLKKRARFFVSMILLFYWGFGIFLIKNNFYDAMIMAIWEVFMIFEYFDMCFGHFQEILQIWSQSWHHLKSPKQIPPQPLNLFFNFFGYRFPAYFPVLCFLYISKESLTCTRLDIDKKSCYSCYPSKKEEKFFKTNFKQQGKFYFFAVISQ